MNRFGRDELLYTFNQSVCLGVCKRALLASIKRHVCNVDVALCWFVKLKTASAHFID